MSESIQSPSFEPVGPQDRILTRLLKDQESDSSANIGERYAVGVNSRTKEELTKVVNSLDEEAGKELVSFLLHAEQCLETRLHLVKAAFARLCVVAEHDEGGAHGTPQSS